MLFSIIYLDVLYLLISSAAVFTPIPGTPGILSDESPAKD